jgi:hypothetical protein
MHEPHSFSDRQWYFSRPGKSLCLKSLYSFPLSLRGKTEGLLNGHQQYLTRHSCWTTTGVYTELHREDFPLPTGYCCEIWRCHLLLKPASSLRRTGETKKGATHYWMNHRRNASRAGKSADLRHGTLNSLHLVRVQKPPLKDLPDGHVGKFCRSASRADSKILLLTVQDMFLKISVQTTLSVPQLTVQAAMFSLSQSAITDCKCFMVWKLSAWESFMVEAPSVPTFAICTPIRKMHVRQFINGWRSVLHSLYNTRKLEFRTSDTDPLDRHSPAVHTRRTQLHSSRRTENSDTDSGIGTRLKVK